MSDERNEAEPIELGYIEDLGDMISFQEGSTVSRTVMQKAGGNVVLFSFDTGEELSEHTAAMPVFVQTLKGRLKVTGNGRTVELVPGGLAYFPTRIPHAIYAEEPSVMMLTMVATTSATEKTRPPASDSIGFADAGDCRKYKKSSLPGAFVLWSGQRDSDPRSQPWQGCALPTKLCPHVFHLGGQRVENIQERPPSRKPGVSRFCGAGLAAAPHDGQT